MAVKVPGSIKSEIRFSYETPGLKAGLLVTGAAVLVFAAYLLFFRGKREKKNPAALSLRVCKRFKAATVKINRNNPDSRLLPADNSGAEKAPDDKV